MLGTHHLPLFIASGLLLNLTPGADSLYVATRSIAHGFRAGAIAALGIGLGCCVHILAAAAGLSAILATSATAFTIVKLAGAAYLVWIGLALMRSAPAAAPEQAKTALPTASTRALFSQGFLTDVLNPKVALFFLAFVPQFIAPQAGNKALAFLFLGGIFALNGTLWCVALAWLSARAGSLKVGRRAIAWLSRGVGAVFVLLGLRLALAGRN